MPVWKCDESSHSCYSWRTRYLKAKNLLCRAQLLSPQSFFKTHQNNTDHKNIHSDKTNQTQSITYPSQLNTSQDFFSTTATSQQYIKWNFSTMATTTSARFLLRRTMAVAAARQSRLLAKPTTIAPFRIAAISTASTPTNQAAPSVKADVVDTHRYENLVEESIKKLMKETNHSEDNEQLRPISNEDLEVRLQYFQVRLELHMKYKISFAISWTSICARERPLAMELKLHNRILFWLI